MRVHCVQANYYVINVCSMRSIQQLKLNCKGNFECNGIQWCFQDFLVINVFKRIQYNSKKEHNYLADGFLATSKDKEPTAGPNERLYITEAVTDVSEQVKNCLLYTSPSPRDQA